MPREITNSDDMIDVRDVIERYEELEDERQTLTDALEETREANIETPTEDYDEIEALQTARDAAKDALDEWTASDDASEHAIFKTLLEELRGNGVDHQWCGDWYPITLIRDEYFEEAMDDLLEDCGDMPKNIPSYLKITVDYSALQMDYSSVEFDGVTYWYR